MSKKFSAQRRRAFLHYLGQTGNQTLAAERAKVSRSWVTLHRAQDAAFDAACRGAIERAQTVLRYAGSTSSPATQDERGGTSPTPAPPLKGRGNRPPRGWGYLDGVELVVGGSNRRYAQVRRARVKQWTPRVEKRFLSVLAATCNVKAACSAVGMWPPSAYAHRRRWPAFAAKWDAAEEFGYTRIEAALVEAGCNLFSEPEIDPEIPIEGMTVWNAIQVLHMHRHQVHGVGGRPGLPPRVMATDEEMVRGIKRALRVTVGPEEWKKLKAEIEADEAGTAARAAKRRRDREGGNEGEEPKFAPPFLTGEDND